MAERVFIDTNVIVYADDLDAGAKRERAREVLHQVFIDGNGVVSTQVLQFHSSSSCGLRTVAIAMSRSLRTPWGKLLVSVSR